MKFSLEWLINIRRNELSSIEMELSAANNKIAEVNSNIDKNNDLISSHKRVLYSAEQGWKIQSAIQSIENCEKANESLEEELSYLIKDKEMILNRYNNKSIEVKLLDKSKERFLEREKLSRSKKEEAEINELALITRKDV